MKIKSSNIVAVILSAFAMIAAMIPQAATAGVSYPQTSSGTQELVSRLYYDGFNVVSESAKVKEDDYILITNAAKTDADCFRVTFSGAFGPGYRIPILRPYGNQGVSYSPTTEIGQRVNGGPAFQYYGVFFIGSQRISVLCVSTPSETYALYTWGAGSEPGSPGTTVDRAQFGGLQIPSEVDNYQGFACLGCDLSSPEVPILWMDMDVAAEVKVLYSKDLKTWQPIGFREEIIPGSELEIARVTFVIKALTVNPPEGGYGQRAFFKVTN